MHRAIHINATDGGYFRQHHGSGTQKNERPCDCAFNASQQAATAIESCHLSAYYVVWWCKVFVYGSKIGW